MSLWKRVLIGLGAGLVVIQVIPYGRAHANPPVVAEPAWDSPATRELAQRACFDCHSNETAWPWYSNVAPISWLTQHDTDEGRAILNFSEWNRPQKETEDAAKTVRKGGMPPRIYLPTHPDARLTDEEKAQLVAGLETTLGGSAEGEGGDNDGDAD